MTRQDPAPRDPQVGRPGGTWGAIGVFIIGLVVVLALIVTLFGPTNTQQAINVPASNPSSNETTPPPAP